MARRSDLSKFLAGPPDGAHAEAGDGPSSPQRSMLHVVNSTARTAVNELRGLAAHAAMYPLGLLGEPLRQHADPRATRDVPVVQVHGYFHNRSGFFVLARALRREGFRWVYALNYNPLGESVQSLAARLARHVEDVRRTSGSEHVHLVGHSLGGLVARWYVQEMDGASRVKRCVTVGTPHRGTMAAYLGVGDAATQMRPGSRVLRRLERSLPATKTGFLNLHGDLDMLIVPSASGILPPLPNVQNRLIRNFGHTSLLLSPELVDAVTHELAEASPASPIAEVRRLRPRSAG